MGFRAGPLRRQPLQCRDNVGMRSQIGVSLAKSKRRSAIVRQRVLLYAMAQLIVTQPQRLGCLPLVPAMLAQRMLHYGALMRIHGRTQIVHMIEIRRAVGGRIDFRSRFLGPRFGR